MILSVDGFGIKNLISAGYVDFMINDAGMESVIVDESLLSDAPGIPLVLEHLRYFRVMNMQFYTIRI